MNLLQQLVNMVHGSQGHQQYVIQPGQKFSSAVQAQNQAPVQNTYNSQGQPTQEVFGDPTRPFSQQSPIQYSPVSRTYAAPAPPPSFSLQSVANMMPQQSQLQGRDNPGAIPLQSSRLIRQPQSSAYDSQLQGNYQRPIANPQNAYQPYNPFQ